MAPTRIFSKFETFSVPNLYIYSHLLALTHTVHSNWESRQVIQKVKFKKTILAHRLISHLLTLAVYSNEKSRQVTQKVKFKKNQFIALTYSWLAISLYNLSMNLDFAFFLLNVIISRKSLLKGSWLKEIPPRISK